MTSNFFQEIQGMSPWLKGGIYGTEGSGKTFTMALIAIGLHRHIKSTKPVVMWDSESGSDFLLPVFRAAGIQLLGRKSRSLKELGSAIRHAQNISDILIIDSLTHAYQELLSAYKKSKRTGGFFIDMRDWGPIKDEWRAQFAHPYVQSPLHIIWGARSKNLFEDVFDAEATERTGQDKYSTVSVGTGAKAETESAYEPSILCEMEKVFAKATKGRKAKGQYSIRMTVNKDRSNQIMGHSFEYSPIDTATAVKECKPFQDILAHFDFIQREGKPGLAYSDEGSEGLFDGGDQASYYKQKREKDICLEEISEEIRRHFGGMDQASKQTRSDLMQEFFDTRSWKKVEILPLAILTAAREKLWLKLNGVTYTMRGGPPDEQPQDLDQQDDTLKKLEGDDIPPPKDKITKKQSTELYKAAREVYETDEKFLKEVGVAQLTDADASLVPHIQKMIDRKRSEKTANAAH